MIAYLAAPYSDPNPQIVKERVHLINICAAKLMDMGYVVFSPISHSHPINQTGFIPPEKQTWDFWRRQDMPILVKCDVLIVLKLAGWEKSIGVQCEIAVAEMLAKGIIYYEIDNLLEII